MEEHISNNLNEKFKACIILHALGDTIGFKNGDWEFNYDQQVDPEYSNDILYEFISLGGIIGINLEDWIISDDTIMHIETCKGLLEETDNINKFGDILSKKYINCLKNMDRRYPGTRTVKSLELIKSGIEWFKILYDPMAGGSGGSMRTSAIGLAFYQENNIDKLIAYSIEASRITHNSVIGYMGGLVSALFTSYAIRNIKINKWPFMLIKLIESNKIDNYLKKTRGYDNYLKDKNQFLGFWKKYIELRFKGNYINDDISMRIPQIRTEFFMEHFSLNPNIGPGFLGHDSVLVAYDAIALSKNNWETLVVYSMLHMGDSDSTGCIAASWYGALYGFEKVPNNNLKYLEYKQELEKLGNSMYNKFGKNKKGGYRLIK